MTLKSNTASMTTSNYDFVRDSLINRHEIAFLDVREEAPHAEGHPLFAANFPLGRIELDAYTKLPRRDVPIVTFDNGEGLSDLAAQRLQAMGYTDVSIFEGGLEMWRKSGGEVFIDVNVPSKSFGELMESRCHTPSLSAEEVGQMIDSNSDMVIVDVRRFDEYQTMCIPGGISVPGAEVVLRIPDLVPDPTTRIIVNCAGRTRSLIGTQSLINAGIANPVAALRNGTIGWTLANQSLDHGQSRSYSETSQETLLQASRQARAVADRAGVKRAVKHDLEEWAKQNNRTTYFFDVRSSDEYLNGHLPGFYPIHGGQLIQETEMYAPVRGARIVLFDDQGARANMSASWLAQMDWDVYVIDHITDDDLIEKGPWSGAIPALNPSNSVSPKTLDDWIKQDDVIVLDFSRQIDFQKGHIPGAWWVLRSNLDEAMAVLPEGCRYVVTSDDARLSQFVAPELKELTNADVFILTGGNDSWLKQGLELDRNDAKLASPAIDRYQRPYEGTEASKEAMQAYLDWEFGLIEQLERDGTHHFNPLVI